MPDTKPLAFMSYVRLEDKYEEGRLSEFRERLSAAVRMQTGEEFPIFQDRNDIRWGQNWKQRIEESLDEVTFFIPIVTPGFFKSRPCRDELERFLERERELNRSDLVLPVYYVGCPVLDDEAKRAKDRLAQAINDHQRADWRDLRFEPFTSAQVGRTLDQLAVQIRDALERVGPTVKPAAGRPKRAAPAARRPGRVRTVASAEESPTASLQKAASQAEATEMGRGPTPKTEPPTRVVDPMHRGDFATITEAIEAANPGDRILVRPGLYRESLIIDKPLEIIGQGPLGDVVVHASQQDAILFSTTMGRIANLVLRRLAGGKFFCVDITQGRLELEDCDISSESLACVGIHGGADPRLRRNRIHDGKQGGVYVHDDGQGTLEDNDIFGNALAGVEIKTGGNPTLRRNRIHDGEQSGVFVYDNGQGTLDDNDILSNARAGVTVKEGGNPTLRHNRIRGNGYEGVWVYEGGAGTIEDNDLRGNTTGALDISEDSAPNVKLARNQE